MVRTLGLIPLLLLGGAAVMSRAWEGTPVLCGAVLGSYFVVLAAARVRIPLVLAAFAPLVGAVALVRSVDSFNRLLTSPRPAPATLEMLGPGILLAVVVGVSVGVRVSRSQGSIASVTGAATLYVAGALLTAGEADSTGMVAAAMVGCAALSWSSLDRRVLLIGLAIVTAVGTATIAPAANAFEPRRRVSPPTVRLVEPNPLPRLAAMTERADEELLRYAGPSGQLQLVTLIDFDGNVWRASGLYQPVGSVAPANVLPASPRRKTSVAEVSIKALDGLWLPSPGDPSDISLPEARVDPETGTLALPRGLRAGQGYSVTGSVDVPDAGLAVAQVPAAERYLQTPRLPYVFAQYAERIVKGTGTPLEQAKLLEAEIRRGRRLDTGAPIGSSYARLSAFLFGIPGPIGPAGSQAGSTEQFANAFAVLARTIGLPSRLRIGFRTQERSPDGTWVVRGRHALVWPEVYFVGQGWVPFDPTPSNQDSGRSAVDQPAQAPQPETSPQPSRANPVPTPSLSPSAQAAPASAPSFPAALLALPLLAPLVLLLLRARRRWRHRRAGARGAWSEVLDVLTLLGRRVPRWHTADRIAADIESIMPAAVGIAAQADRATFAATPDGSSSSWSEVRRLRLRAKRQLPWYRRLLWPLDPRPLRRDS